jgi:corrinoid protein of di/trimethylamine methyltransferase
MTHREILNAIKDFIISQDLVAVREACEEAVGTGIAPSLVISEAMGPAMNVVGDKFEAGEYFLTDLIAAGAAMEEGLKVLEPHLKMDERKKGKVVLGTVEGDIHSIGKDVVKMLLKATGFDVIDLGEDVPAAKFVEAARVHKPMILGMSALITASMPEMRRVIEELEKAGLRDHLRIMVGGAPLSREYARIIGADAYAPDAVAGSKIGNDWAQTGDHQ